MKDQREWLAAFEQKFGRKPELDEFMKAKSNGFEDAVDEAESAGSEPESVLAEPGESGRAAEAEPVSVAAAESADSEKSEFAESSEPKSLQDRWLTYFEEVKGRKPEMSEFLSAEESDFDMAELEAEATQNTAYLHTEKAPEDVWKEAFQKKHGRLPNFAEFSFAKQNDFSLKALEEGPATAADKTAKRPKLKKVPVDEVSNSRKKLKIAAVISACLLFVVLVGLVFFGFIRYSRNNQLTRLKETLDSNNADKIAKIVQTNDSGFKVNAKNIKPFVDYLTRNPTYAADLSEAIENDTAKKSNSDVYVVRAGSQLLLYPKYVLKMNLVYPEITAERSGTTVTFDGKELGKTTADNQTLKPGAYVPGSYELKGAFTLNDQALNSSQEVDLTRFGHDDFTQNLALEFKITAPTVRCSTFPDAEVWIDNEKVGQLTNGLLYLPEMAYTSGMEIYLRKSFPSKTIESSHRELVEGYPDITLDFNKVFSGNVSDYKTVINNFLTQYYKTEAGLTQNSRLNSFLEKGASTPEYNDYITNHFATIKAQNDTYNHANINEIKAQKLYKFDGYYYKYNQDADISLVDITDSELVFNVNFSEVQYWNMYSSASPSGGKDGDGYQLFHWTERQIIINSSQAENLLNSSANYDPNTGYIKIRSFGNAVGDSAVNNPNINWNSLN
ncbi:TcaA second domain-containing protein [Lactovum odontotermitis]